MVESRLECERVLERELSPPCLSVVVVFHNMRREARRTLLSLAPTYQCGVEAEDYEIIAIDNGSSVPIDFEEVRGVAPNVRYLFHNTDSMSPVGALNLGGELARGRFVALIADGARMASPGLVRATLDALTLHPMPFLCSLAWHLGPAVQNESILEGYDQAAEDRLLDQIGWPADGYRLFEISTLAQSSRPGFLGGFPRECSWLALSRAGFESLGGYDPAFASPGGGLANHDIVVRAVSYGQFGFFVLLGEGVFHQIHGGIATNVKPQDHPIKMFKEEYQRIRGVTYQPTTIENVNYFGTMRSCARRFLAK